MLTRQGASSAIQLAVVDYFAGERSEMWIAMAVFLVTAAAAVWLFVSTPSGFALGLMATVVLFGSLMGAGLASLMIRDHTASRVLKQNLKTEQHALAIARETTRVGIVLSRFKFYRLGAGILAVLAVAGLMLSSRAWLHGAAMGLLLVVIAQFVIDYFSEQRAHIYLAKLSGVAKTTPTYPARNS